MTMTATGDSHMTTCLGCLGRHDKAGIISMSCQPPNVAKAGKEGNIADVLVYKLHQCTQALSCISLGEL